MSVLDHAIYLTPELGRMTVDTVGVFPRGHLSIVAGEPGIGKTWLMLSIARAIAKGAVGIGDPITPYPQGRALLFAGETGVRLLASRIDLMGGLGDELSRVCVISSHVMAGLGLDVMCDTASGRANIEEAVRGFKPDIVFFDTLISFLGDGKDESSQVDMGEALRGLGRVCSASGAAFVLLHHFRKRQSGEERSRSMSDVIGSSALTRLASLVVGVERKGSVRMVRCLKSWWEEFAPFSFVITKDETGNVYLKGDYNYETDGTYSVSRTNSRVAAHILSHFVDVEFSVMDVVSGLEVSRNSAQEAISGLCSHRKAWCVGKQGHTKYYRLGQPDDGMFTEGDGNEAQ